MAQAPCSWDAGIDGRRPLQADMLQTVVKSAPDVIWQSEGRTKTAKPAAIVRVLIGSWTFEKASMMDRIGR